MKITAQEEYGVRCLLRLARAGAPLTIPEVASAENLSPAYVGKLLAVLRQEGLVESQRGRSGGYQLSRPPAEVRLGEALRALGEPLFDDPGYCEKHAGPETTGPCVHTDGCHLRGVWQALARYMQHFLDQVTLQDLLSGEAPAVRRLREQLSSERPLLTLSRP